MLQYIVEVKEACKLLRADRQGVVSFEYVIVAACIVGAVTIAFGTSAGGNIATALTTAITTITTAVTTAV